MTFLGLGVIIGTTTVFTPIIGFATGGFIAAFSFSQLGGHIAALFDGHINEGIYGQQSATIMLTGMIFGSFGIWAGVEIFASLHNLYTIANAITMRDVLFSVVLGYAIADGFGLFMTSSWILDAKFGPAADMTTMQSWFLFVQWGWVGLYLIGTALSILLLKTSLLTSKPIWPYNTTSLSVTVAQQTISSELKIAQQEAEEEEKKLADRLRTLSTEDIDSMDDEIPIED